MKSTVLKVLPLIAALGFSANGFAGDDKICSLETVQTPIYEGFASCTSGGNYISQYVFSSPSSTAYITELVNGLYYSCWANVPYSHTETHQVEQCEYTPVSKFYISQTPHNLIGTNIVTISSTASDRDGSLVKHEWWVNGVATSTSLNGGKTLRLSTHNGRYVDIKLRVTDNDGHQDTYERKNVWLQEWSCDRSCNLY